MKGKVVFFFLVLLIGVAGLAGPAFGTSYFGYDEWGDDTWHDADKTWSNTDDDLMCWAAAASNILAWTGWGNPADENFTGHDDMFGHFQEHWTDSGGWMEYGWNWWFDGTEPPAGSSEVDVKGGGNFWPEYNFVDYYYEWDLWDIYDDITGYWDGSGALPTVDGFLHSGYGVTLAIYGPGATPSHAGDMNTMRRGITSEFI